MSFRNAIRHKDFCLTGFSSLYGLIHHQKTCDTKGLVGFPLRNCNHEEESKNSGEEKNWRNAEGAAALRLVRSKGGEAWRFGMSGSARLLRPAPRSFDAIKSATRSFRPWTAAALRFRGSWPLHPFRNSR